MKTKRLMSGISVLLAITLLLFSACGKPNLPDGSAAEGTGKGGSPAVETSKDSEHINAAVGYHSDYYWDDESDRVAAGVQYPYVHLSEADQKAHPKLEQAITELMQDREGIALEQYNKAIKAAEETSVEDIEDIEFAPYFDVNETAAVRRADNRVFSLLLEGHVYTGGPHEQPYTLGAVFDSKSGKQLKLTDVVTDEELLLDLTIEELENFWETEHFFDDWKTQVGDIFRDSLDSVAWILDYHGLSIYFQPYQVVSYSFGCPNITISFEEHPELIKEEYRQVPKNYGIEFSQMVPFYYDADGDSTLDNIHVGTGEMQSVAVNENSLEEDNGIFEVKPTLLHTEDGKNYLYLAQMYPDDHWVFEVFDLSTGKPEKIDTVYREHHQIVDYVGDAEIWISRLALTDPQHMTLDTYTTALGTEYGYADYHIGKDGLPEQDGEGYIMENETEMQLLQSTTGEVIEKNGKSGGKTVELKEGDQVIYYRTDGETWADVKCEDGTIVRVRFRYNEDEWTVNGIAIEELFDGAIIGG